MIISKAKKIASSTCEAVSSQPGKRSNPAPKAAVTGSFSVAAWGYEPAWSIPWDIVGLGIAATLGTCLIAGLFPARYAARSNIVAAMSST